MKVHLFLTRILTLFISVSLVAPNPAWALRIQASSETTVKTDLEQELLEPSAAGMEEKLSYRFAAISDTVQGKAGAFLVVEDVPRYFLTVRDEIFPVVEYSSGNAQLGPQLQDTDAYTLMLRSLSKATIELSRLLPSETTLKLAERFGMVSVNPHIHVELVYEEAEVVVIINGYTVYRINRENAWEVKRELKEIALEEGDDPEFALAVAMPALYLDNTLREKLAEQPNIATLFQQLPSEIREAAGMEDGGQAPESEPAYERTVSVPKLGRTFYEADGILSAANVGAQLYLRLILDHPDPDHFKNKTILEIGTGSGVLAVTLARMGATVVALDISEVAIRLAEENLKQEPPEVRARVTFGVSDVYDDLSKITKIKQFDMVISNNATMRTDPVVGVDATYIAGAGEQFQFPAKIVAGLDKLVKPNGEGAYMTTRGVPDEELPRRLTIGYLRRNLLPEGWEAEATGYEIPGDDDEASVIIAHLHRTAAGMETVSADGGELEESLTEDSAFETIWAAVEEAGSKGGKALTVNFSADLIVDPLSFKAIYDNPRSLRSALKHAFGQSLYGVTMERTGSFFLSSKAMPETGEKTISKKFTTITIESSAQELKEHPLEGTLTLPGEDRTQYLVKKLLATGVMTRKIVDGRLGDLKGLPDAQLVGAKYVYEKPPSAAGMEQGQGTRVGELLIPPQGIPLTWYSTLQETGELVPSELLPILDPEAPRIVASTEYPSANITQQTLVTIQEGVISGRVLDALEAAGVRLRLFDNLEAIPQAVPGVENVYLLDVALGSEREWVLSPEAIIINLRSQDPESKPDSPEELAALINIAREAAGKILRVRRIYRQPGLGMPVIAIDTQV